MPEKQKKRYITYKAGVEHHACSSGTMPETLADSSVAFNNPALSNLKVGWTGNPCVLARQQADSYLKDKFLTSRARHRPSCTCCSGEGCVRSLNCLRFCIVCSASLLQVLTPWVLCVGEVLAVLLIYFLGTSHPLFIHEKPSKYHFSYMRSLEDVVGLCCARSALLSIAYAAGMRHMHRPYLYSSYLLAAACFPYIIVKIILFRYSKDAVAASAIFIITGLFCWAHVFAARRTVEWARRRYQMGLAGFGYPWEEGEEAWSLLKRSPDLEAMTKNSDAGDGDGDVAADCLADEDSKFLDVDGIKVHYKEVAPPTVVPSVNDKVAVVLVHGFGGGVFAWRHIMGPLAVHCQCRVLAFDRPAFGLTSRPPPRADRDNPYAMGSQAHLLLQLCGMLGIERIIIAAHADGCLLALRAASMATMLPRPTNLEQSPTGSNNGRQAPTTAGMAVAANELTPRWLSSNTGAAWAQADPVASAMPPAALSDAVLSSLALRKPPLSGDGATPSSRDSLSSAPAAVSAAAGSGIGGVNVALGMRTGSGGEVCSIEVAAEVAASSPTASASVGITEGTRHRRTQSMTGPSATSSGRMHHHVEEQRQGPVQHVAHPTVVGLALLHPNLSGQMGPALSRLLSRSKLGRSILRPLLRTEVGEVSNRRSWYNLDKLTPEVLELYKAPLRVEGWCESLIETTRLPREHVVGNLPAYLNDARNLPVLLLTGEHDSIVPPNRLDQLRQELPGSRMVFMQGCGHLSHEEAPVHLLDQLVLFSGYVLRTCIRKVEEPMCRPPSAPPSHVQDSA